MSSLVHYSWLIPLLPLLGAAVAGFAGAKYLRGQSHWPIWLGVGGSAVISLVILFGLATASPDGQVHFSYASHATHDVAGEPAEAAAEPEAAEHAGPDGRVRSYTTRWYTWIGIGNPAEKGMRPGQPAAAATPGRPAAAAPQARTAGGYFDIAAGAFIDPLTGVMLGVVTGIGFLITVFAAGYMKGEEGYWRFFAYLGLFLFAMTILVMGENLIMLYLGWEGVGLCSYLLIGYYYQKPAAREAAKKAFLVNRVGDFGFAIGIMLIFYCYGTVSYFGEGVGSFTGFVEMASNSAAYCAPGREWLLPYIPFALMLGAFGKSAQFPLYVWLPDAMEGPTPVSALIHAATMVTAGVYMIARLAPVFYAVNSALVTIAAVGAFTALFAATIGMRQFDLKKVFAYSTISQLGYMIVGVAVLAPTAAVFHLMTHAFFKALLFLSSGVVMHAMLGHLDLRKMSGLKHVLPKTRWLMLAGCLALAGFPLTSGFFSKDEIIHFAGHNSGSWVLSGVLLLAAFITAYYTFRLYFRVFEGPLLVPDTAAPDHHGSHDHDLADASGHASASAVQDGDIAESGVDAPHGETEPQAHGDHHGHDHEPAIMILPLVVLAAGALFAWVFNPPGLHWMASFLGTSPSIAYGYDVAMQTYGAQMTTEHAREAFAEGFGYGGEIEWLGLIVGGVVSLAGIGVAYYLHLVDRGMATSLAHTFRPAAKLLEGKYFVDQIYDAIIVRPLRFLGKVLFWIDDWVVDGLATLVSNLPWGGGLALRVTTQRGNLQGYAVSMLFGIAAILLLLFL